MGIKKIGVLAGIVAIGGLATYGIFSKRIFNDVLTRGKSSLAKDATNYKELDIVNEYACDCWLPSMPYQEVYVTSIDQLQLHGYMIEQENTAPWMIIVHGYQVNAFSLMASAKVFYENGYSVLVIDQRSHGKSEGTYITMGWLERNDIMTWITYLVAKQPTCKIALYGVSMGGATVMMATGEQLSSHVVCAIEDCGYTSVEDILLDQANKKYHLDHPMIVSGISYFCKKYLGFYLHEASSIEQLKKSTIPTLFIHGQMDTFVPFEMVYQNYEACHSEKELFLVEGQEHALACMDPLYYPTVLAFIKKYM